MFPEFRKRGIPAGTGMSDNQFLALLFSAFGSALPSRLTRSRLTIFSLILYPFALSLFAFPPRPSLLTARGSCVSKGHLDGRDAKIYCDEAAENYVFTRAFMTILSVVHSDPEILGGTPVFRGTRVPLRNLFDYLEHGHDIDEFLDAFPSVSREQGIAVLQTRMRF